MIVITSNSAVFTLNKGAAVFDDIRVSVTGSGKYIHGNGSICFTENFRFNNALTFRPPITPIPKRALISEVCFLTFSPKAPTARRKASASVLPPPPTQGLRFILTLLMNRDGAENLFTDFGAVVIPIAMAEGENTTLSTDRVGVVSKKDVRRRLPLFHPFRLVGFVYGMHHRNAACEIRPSFHRSAVCRLHRKRNRIYGLRRI